MVWGAVIGAAASLAAAYMSSEGAKDQQSRSEDYAREQRDWQEYMSSTAHQREVADLRASGLNPILSTRHGGASSPTGAMATAINTIGDAGLRGVASAMQAMQLEGQLELMKEDTRLRQIQQQSTDADASLKTTQALKVVEEQKNVEQDTKNKEKIGDILNNQKAVSALDAEKARAEKEFYDTTFGKFMRRLGASAGELGRLFGTGNSARSLIER